MLATQLQSSLDQLLQVLKRANHDEKIHFNYVSKCREVDNFISDSSEVLLRIEAHGDTINFIDRPSLNSEKISNNSTVSLTIEDISSEFLQTIDDLCVISRSKLFFKPGIVTYLTNTDCSFRENIANTFIRIIYRICKGDSRVTAEKLLNLRYHLRQVVSLGKPDVIEHMITLGCSVDGYHTYESTLYQQSVTALIAAVSCSNSEIFKVLLKNGANVDLADSDGLLPIAYHRSGCLVRKITEQPEIVEILLNKSIVLKNLPEKKLLRQLKNPFERGNKQVIQMLLEYRNDILNMRDEEGQTPLHYLCRNKNSNITELLKGKKFDVNVRDSDGRTPLYTAQKSLYIPINTFEFLLKNGANVNDTNEKNFQNSPHYKLCSVHFILPQLLHIEIINLFLKNNLDIQFVWPSQQTVFDLLITQRWPFYVAEQFLGHLAILEERGIPITKLIYHKINSNQSLKNYFDNCKTELTNVKNKSKNKRINLYEILINSEEKTLRMCRGYLSSKSQLENLKNECQSNHAYYVTIKKRISSTIKSIELYQVAAPILCKLLNSRIDENNLIVLEIVDYLDDEDLQTLTEIDVE